MSVKEGRMFIGKFSHKADLLESLNKFCQDNNIKLGVFSVIGAVRCAKMGYYKQDEQQYIECVNLEKKLEIVSCLGNISLKDEKPFVHAHITLADWQGQCYGGHLMPGTVIFAAEYYIKELTGLELKRGLDKETGLSLWI